MKRVKIKLSGFRNSFHILPEDKAEKLLIKVYKEKAAFIKLRGDVLNNPLKIEMWFVHVRL